MQYTARLQSGFGFGATATRSQSFFGASESETPGGFDAFGKRQRLRAGGDPPFWREKVGRAPSVECQSMRHRQPFR